MPTNSRRWRRRSAAAATVSGGGAIQDVTTIGVNASTDAAKGSEVQVISVVTHAGGKQLKLAMRQVKVGDQWKIVDVQEAK